MFHTKAIAWIKIGGERDEEKDKQFGVSAALTHWEGGGGAYVESPGGKVYFEKVCDYN